MNIQQGACHSDVVTLRSLALPPRSLVAPRWHTALLVVLVVGVAALGTLLTSTSGDLPRGARVPGPAWVAFLPLLLVEWTLVLYVARIARPASVLSELIGERWNTLDRALRDIAWAVGATVVIVALELSSSSFFGTTRDASVAALFPRTPAERAGWIVLATAVGFCEEVVYRGYLQTQLLAFTRSPAAAILGSAAIFGVAHLEQGGGAALRIAIAGAVLGVVARRRSSLVPGVLCHAGIDLAAGLLAP